MTEEETEMIQEEELLREAEKAGFDHYKILSARKVQFDHSLRKYCEVNYCGNYGKNYSCPPACGTPEEIAQTFHFSGKLKKVFFDLRYRNISHGSRFVKEKRERVPPKERNGDGR